jgi:hypothetical protein
VDSWLANYYGCSNAIKERYHRLVKYPTDRAYKKGLYEKRKNPQNQQMGPGPPVPPRRWRSVQLSHELNPLFFLVPSARCYNPKKKFSNVMHFWRVMLECRL